MVTNHTEIWSPAPDSALAHPAGQTQEGDAGDYMLRGAGEVLT